MTKELIKESLNKPQEFINLVTEEVIIIEGGWNKIVKLGGLKNILINGEWKDWINFKLI